MGMDYSHFKFLNVGSSLDITELNRTALNVGGDNFKVAGNGQQALEQLAQMGLLPDLVIITNFGMPIMNGRDFLKRFREEERYSRIPVLVTHDMPWEYEDTLNFNRVYFLRKPYQLDDFKRKIEEILQNN